MTHLRAGNCFMGIAVTAILASSASAAYQEVGLSTGQGREVCVYGSGSPENPFSTRGNPSIVHLLDLSTGTSAVVWEAARHFFDLSISANGNWIAFREPVDEPDRIALRVISRDGNTVALVEYVERYAWSPDGNQVAYITGESFEGGLGFRDGRGGILDVRSGRSRSIQGSDETALGVYDVTWASWDNGVYFMVWVRTGNGSGCARYDDTSDTLTITDVSGIYFSPSGEYYYRPDYEGSPFELVRRDTNEDISKRLGLEEYEWPRFWLDNETLVLPRASTLSEPFDRLVNVVDGTKVVVPGQVIGLGLDGSVLYVPRGGADEGKEYLARMPWKASPAKAASASVVSTPSVSVEDGEASPVEEEHSSTIAPPDNFPDEGTPREDASNVEMPDLPASDVQPEDEAPLLVLVLGSLGVIVLLSVLGVAWKRRGFRIA